MADLALVIATVAFFAVGALFVHALDRP